MVRGKWLLENMLGAPPPPPPPNVPALKRTTEADTAAVGARADGGAPQESACCACCHARMDPLGFALENFDAIGRWRDTTEAGTPIDASGKLPDGTTFRRRRSFAQS